MKKTLILIASLASCSLSAQAATLWTTDFGNAAQSTATDVTLINTGEMSGITGTVDSLKKTLHNGGAESDCSLKTSGALGENASLFTPDVNVQTSGGGSWTAGMTFTNTGSQGCTISSVQMTMISFSGGGAAQNGAKDFSLTLNLGGQAVTVTATIPGGNGSTGTPVTLTFSQPIELGAGDTLNFSVLVDKATQTDGSFFGIKSMEFQGALQVPEPATASLGLLGLAVLMMRRRRA